MVCSTAVNCTCGEERKKEKEVTNSDSSLTVCLTTHKDQLLTYLEVNVGFPI